MIYADLAIAMPLALSALIIIAVLSAANQITVDSSIAYFTKELGLYSGSQVLVSSIYSINSNYSEALSLLEYYSKQYNMSVGIYEYGLYSCPAQSVCRIVSLSGKEYVMVVG
ncbi:MAG: hypothetical protein QXF01_00455 [Candidatus Micrarchaeaceae archaeon]